MKNVRELALVFLKLGLTAFGGPAAHIAMMEEEVVRRRRWLSQEEFLDLLGAANLIPGPNSTELAIFVGHRRAGWPGWIVAGACFILPATVLVTAIAWVYVRFGSLPEMSAILYGIKPVIIAVVLQALWSLGRTAVKSRSLATLAAICAVLNMLGINEILLIFAAGFIGLGLRKKRPESVQLFSPFLAGAAAAMPAPILGAAAVPFSLTALFGFFLKVGSVLFGSGYVLLAFLRADLVQRWGWLTENQLLDAVAVGQFTPGPLFTTATFIGYLLGGGPGALVATAGIFLPAFVFVAITAPWVRRIRASPTAGSFLDAVNAAWAIN